MPFPPSDREVYKVNPLNEVICQLRFPAILKVSAEPPAKYQDAIRGKYPLYAKKNEASGFSGQLPPEVVSALGSIPFLSAGESLEHHFSIPDESRSISLTQEYIALTDRQYTRWEKFREELLLAETVFRETYEPTYYARIGLRYVDVLMRSRFNAPDTPWSEFLNSSFIGILGSQEVAGDVQETYTQSVLNIPDVDGGRVVIKHGLTRTQEENEQVYLIDADFYTDRRSDSNEAVGYLDRFNRWGGYLFRWATTPELRDALGKERI